MIRLVPLIALCGSGCVNTVRFPPDLWASTWDSGFRTWDSADPRLEEEEPQENRGVELAEVRCDETNASWTWTARTRGWVGEARINVFRTADQQIEEHRMRLTASDPEGGWDDVQTGPLPDATPVADQVPEVNTRFDCEGDAETLSFVVRVWDGDLLDCVVWGADPAGATAGIRLLDPDVLGLGGCREMGG